MPAGFIVSGLFLCENMTIGGRGDLAAWPPCQQAFLRPPILFLEGGLMLDIDRLIAAGLPSEAAFETAWWFAHYGNDSGLERYVCELRNGQRERGNDG